MKTGLNSQIFTDYLRQTDKTLHLLFDNILTRFYNEELTTITFT